MSHHFAKPENALRKALDLVKVDKHDAALRILHSMLLSRRYRAWQPAHEEIMMLYIQLAVDNRKNAKDGLLQYRNICQAVQIDSLEKILKEFIRLAEARATRAENDSAAKMAADAAIAMQVEAVPLELELDESLGYRPEVNHYFVSGIGGDDEADRGRRELVTPWLKYLWDAYRSVLDVMRNNQHLDKLYHRTARKALAYCINHQRSSEFRRLCEIMRIHLNTIITYQGQTHSVDLKQPETIQAYLRTRFAQLECASQLDLWQEAYRIIEDIHELLHRSTSQLDAALLSTYYQKLELIFWKSGNGLFHAYCVEKLCALSINGPPAAEGAAVMSTDDLSDRLVIAALSIPLQAASSAHSSAYLDSEDQKNLKLSTMLGFQGPPSRVRMMQSLQGSDTVRRASPLVQKILRLLTSVTSPLEMSRTASPLLDELKQCEHLAQYHTALSNVVVLLILQQCAKVYSCLRLEKFVQMLPIGYSSNHVEHLIVGWVQEHTVRVRIDQISSLLQFSTDIFGDGLLRDILPSLSRSLQRCVDEIHPIAPEDKEIQRVQVFQLVKYGMDQEHRDVFIRKAVIEQRKQEFETAAHHRSIAEKQRLHAMRQKAMVEEQNRLEEEKKRRERERDERLERERVMAANKILIDKLKAAAIADSMTVRSTKLIESLEKNSETVDREKLLEAQSEVQSQEQKARERKQKEDFKRLDYISRALRIEEKPLLVTKHEQQRMDDRAYYEEMWEKHQVAHREKFDNSVADKSRLARMEPFRTLFYAQIMAKREKFHDEEMAYYEEQLFNAEQERLAEMERRAEEEAQLQKIAEEEERIIAEKEKIIATAKAEEDRILAEREEVEAAHKEKAARTFAMQKQREADIEARKAAEKAAALAPKPLIARSAAVPVPEKDMWRRDQPAAPVSTATGPAVGTWTSKRVASAGGGVAAPGPVFSRPSGSIPSDSSRFEAGNSGTSAPRLNLNPKQGSGMSWREKAAAKAASSDSTSKPNNQ